MYALFRVFLLASPRHKKDALTNLALAFPNHTQQQNIEILYASCKRFVRGLVDTLRLPQMNSAWVKENVDFPSSQAVIDAIARAPNNSALFVTGHFNSFEILPRCISAYVNRTGWFVARALKNKKVDAWWNELRGEQGNAVINRTGGLKKIIDLIQKGECIGLLFDQNVTKKQAVFVDWFGEQAATTKAMAYCHLKFKIPIILVSMHNLPDERYLINAEIFEFEENQSESLQGVDINNTIVLEQITQKVSDAFCKLVTQEPEAWFWLHRRWKTRPGLEAGDFYRKA